MTWAEKGDSLRIIDPQPGTKTLVVTRRGARDIVASDGLVRCDFEARLAAAADSTRAAEAETRRLVATHRRAGRPLLVTAVTATGDDTHTGAEFEWIAFPRREIKYLRFTVIPYNRVGDVVTTRQGGGARTLTAIGPIEATDDPVSGSVSLDYTWWEGSITCLVLARLVVEYRTGAPQTFTGAALRAMLGPDEPNTCR